MNELFHSRISKADQRLITNYWYDAEKEDMIDLIMRFVPFQILQVQAKRQFHHENRNPQCDRDQHLQDLFEKVDDSYIREEGELLKIATQNQLEGK